DSTDWGILIAQLRAALARYQKLMPPPIISSDGESPAVRYHLDDAPEGALLGNPVSPGVVEGVVHVIRDPQRETLAPDEILVAEFTDPGWTPLFINACGLILEVGGALTHGAVVAREYGIPAVVGVRGALTTLQTGQRVRLDGNRGIIELL
ncbi:MAG: PEP-utilizing enzyme, partial [Anaerolineales bacterium]|nr:PEP-utilizing enzyme [Anaerolineales bacterium]